MCIYIYIHISIHKYTYINSYIYIYVYIDIHIYIGIYIDIHMYIHTSIHIPIHICTHYICKTIYGPIGLCGYKVVSTMSVYILCQKIKEQFSYSHHRKCGSFFSFSGYSYGNSWDCV